MNQTNQNPQVAHLRKVASGIGVLRMVHALDMDTTVFAKTAAAIGDAQLMTLADDMCYALAAYESNPQHTSKVAAAVDQGGAILEMRKEAAGGIMGSLRGMGGALSDAFQAGRGGAGLADNAGVLNRAAYFAGNMPKTTAALGAGAAGGAAAGGAALNAATGPPTASEQLMEGDIGGAARTAMNAFRGQGGGTTGLDRLMGRSGSLY